MSHGPNIGPQLPPSFVTENLPNHFLSELTGHDGPVLAVRFNSNGNHCVSCGKDRTLRLWNPRRGLLIKTYQGHGYDVRDVAVSKDNSRLASCGGDRNIFLWDVGSGQIIRKFRGHDGVVNSVCYAAEDQILVTGGYDQSVCLWDCRANSFDAIQTIKCFADSVTSVKTTSSPEILAGSVDGTVRRFDVRMGAQFTDEVGHPVTSIAVSKDGLSVLAACTDGALRMLDKQDGDLLAQYSGHVHSSVKLDCAIMPSAAYVLCGSEDGKVCFWDHLTEDMVDSFDAHKGPVCSLAVNPAGDLLLTASTDGTIRSWCVDPDAV